MSALPPDSPQQASEAAEIRFSGWGWTGHRPGTRARLIAIFERAMSAGGTVTLAERGFVTACEFWVLAMSRELHTRTGPGAIARLEFAAIVYDSIGAPGVAEALRAAHRDLASRQTALHRRRRLTQLEDELLQWKGEVDGLLEQLANQLAIGDVHTNGDTPQSATKFSSA